MHDSIVNQLLSKIDGVEALNNVLIIGMTNRKDLIDSALLRPGRLEVHVEIGLPSHEGRVQILSIHTNTMRSNGYLADDVDLNALADLTKNFTGAELEGLVKSASSFALEREVDINNLSKVSIDPEKMRVTWQDFQRALQEVQPAFGLEKDELSIRYRNGIIEYSDEFRKLYSELMTMVDQVRTSDQTPLMSVCLDGIQGARWLCALIDRLRKDRAGRLSGGAVEVPLREVHLRRYAAGSGRQLEGGPDLRDLPGRLQVAAVDDHSGRSGAIGGVRATRTALQQLRAAGAAGAD